MKYGRCNKNLKEVNYGGYISAKRINLCSECWEIWIAMRSKHYREEEQFLDNKGIGKND